MTASQIRCLLALLALSRPGGKVFSKDVADALGISRPSAHRLLEALVLQGYVEKEAYGRAVLTDAGRGEAERMAKHKEALARSFEKQFAVSEDQSGLAAVALMCTLDEETLVRIENSGKSER